MATVFLGIGSNLGDRQANIERAITLLGEGEETRVLSVSALIETEPVGGPSQGLYLNGAAKIQTELLPLDLLSRLKTIERRLGRVIPPPVSSHHSFDTIREANRPPLAAKRVVGSSAEGGPIRHGGSKETGGGMMKSEPNAPRPIDLDILFYDDVVIVDGKSLTIPHPRLAQRGFVLKPMVEIAPDLVHPRLGKTIRELYEQYESDSKGPAA